MVLFLFLGGEEEEELGRERARTIGRRLRAERC